MTVLLASGSPRRRMLLESAGLEVVVHATDADESWVPGADPVLHACALAARKAALAPTDRGPVVAADTVVHVDGVIFDKTADRDLAAATLRRLSGRWHAVSTGVSVRGRVFAVTTEVRFRTLAEGDIARYLATGEADDKAGAYGIQGAGMALVAEVRGSFTNVVGLPLEETLAALRA